MSAIIIIDGGLTFAILANPHDYVGSNTDKVHIPSSAQAGDFCVMLDMGLSDTAVIPANVTPPGWTFAVVTAGGNSDDGNRARLNVLWKILASGEPDTDVTGINGAQRNRKIMITMRPSRPIQSVTAGGWTTRCGNGDPGSILVPAAAAPAGGAVVVIGLAASQNAVTPFAWSPAADDVNVDGTLVTRGGFKLYPTGVTPAAHTIDMDDEGDINGLAAGYFVFD